MAAPQLKVYIQGQGVVAADGLNTFEQTCDTFSDLRAFIGVPGLQAFSRGATAVNDGLGGAFYWNASGTGPDDNQNNIVPSGAALGCWTRLVGVVSSSLEVFLSGYTTLAAANAAAVAGGGVLVLDKNATITTNTVITAPYVRPAGGILTRGSNTLAFTGKIIAPDNIAFLDVAGSGSVSFADSRCSLAWFGAKQDTTPLGATVTDNTSAWSVACVAASGGQLRVPALNPTKCYAVTTGGTVTGPTEVIFDDGAYMQHQGAGYCLNYQGSGSTTGIHVKFRTYGSAVGSGGVNFQGSTGLLTVDPFIYGYTNGEAICFTGTTFNYLLQNPYIRNCKRWLKERAGYANTVNTVKSNGGIYENDSTCAGDVNGLIQLDRGNGWQFYGKPDIEQGHATPVPLVKLAQIAYVDVNDSQVLNFDFGDADIEGNYTGLLICGVGATFPSSVQNPRDIFGEFNQVASAMSGGNPMADLAGVFGFRLNFGDNLPAGLWRYNAACADGAIDMLNNSGGNTPNTSATNIVIREPGSISMDNNVTQIVQGKSIHVGVNQGLTLVSQTTTVGAGAGTLANAPHAGDPTGYLQILVNGAVKKVPFWDT